LRPTRSLAVGWAVGLQRRCRPGARTHARGRRDGIGPGALPRRMGGFVRGSARAPGQPAWRACGPTRANRANLVTGAEAAGSVGRRSRSLGVHVRCQDSPFRGQALWCEMPQAAPPGRRKSTARHRGSAAPFEGQGVGVVFDCPRCSKLAPAPGASAAAIGSTAASSGRPSVARWSPWGGTCCSKDLVRRASVGRCPWPPTSPSWSVRWSGGRHGHSLLRRAATMV